DVAFTRDGKRLLIAFADGWVRDWAFDQEQLPRPLGKHDRGAMAVRCVDDNIALSLGADSTLRLWDLEKAKERYRVFSAYASYMGQLAVTPDLRFAVTSSGPGLVVYQLPVLRPGAGLTPADSPGQLILDSEAHGYNLQFSLQGRTFGLYPHLGVNVNNYQAG